MQRKQKKWGILLLIVCLIFTACASATDTAPQISNETKKLITSKSYVVLPKKVEVLNGYNASNYYSFAGNIYTASKQEEGEYYKLSCLEKEKLWGENKDLSFDEISIMLESSYQIEYFFLDEKGNLLFITSLTTDGAKDILLQEFNPEGSLIKKVDLTEIYKTVYGENADIYISTGIKSNQGKIYLADLLVENRMLVLNEDGSLFANISFGDTPLEDLIMGTDDKVYALGKYQNTEFIYIWNEKMERLETITVVPNSKGNGKLVAGSGGIVLYSYYEGIYAYSPESKEGMEIYKWANAGITGKEIADFFYDEEERLCVILKTENKTDSFSIILLREKTAEEVSRKKQKVIVAGDQGDVFLAKTVGKFNASNLDYEVVLQSYDYSRMLVELMTGNGPDLIPMDTIDSKEGVRKGLIEDLSPYLANSRLLSEEQLVSKVIELKTIDGVLTSIPPTFYILTLMGRASELGNEVGWTMEEFMEYVEGHRGATIFEGSTYGETNIWIMLNAWKTMQDKFVDLDEGEAHFDTPEFKELLEFAATYEAKYDEDKTATSTKIREKKVLLCNYALFNIEQYLFCEGIFEGDMVAIGYPTWSGEPYHRIDFYGDYGINSKSKQKQGAWEFLEYMVASQTWKESYNYGMPTLRSAFEEKIENLVPEGGSKMGDGAGEIIIIPPPTEEEKQDLYEIIENSYYPNIGLSELGGIYTEEIYAWYNNKRSAEETAKVIQNRIQLYLDENTR